MNKKFIGVLLITPSLMILLGFGSVYIGGSNISILELYTSFTHFDRNNIHHQIIMNERVPHMLAILIAGAMLSLAGTIMQAVTRNYLASPSLMGVNDGAQLFITIGLILTPQITHIKLIAFSIFGSFFGITLILILSYLLKTKLTPISMVILGIVLGAFLNSISVIIALYFQLSQAMLNWYNAKILSIDVGLLKLSLIIAVVLFILSFTMCQQLNILSLDTQLAKGLGQNTTIVYILLIFLVVALTGVTTALVGSISFVGLIIPHITRMIVGSNYTKIVPFSIIFGACFLLLCDILSKFINYPFPTPISIPTSLIGVPFFLYLIRKRGHQNVL